MMLTKRPTQCAIILWELARAGEKMGGLDNGISLSVK